MLKKILSSIIGFLAILFAAGMVFAASNVSIRLEQPKSPTNQNSFNVVFVTLDTMNRAITVKCFKKGPSDASFAQYGADINLAPGGNTGNCQVNGSIVSATGTYQFKASAQAGGDLAESAIVSVDYNNTTGPGTPTNYSKEKITSCVWRISFRTADDGGKTVKVELYRSNSDTDLTSTTQVDSQNIGSNTDGHFDYTAPDCNKTYYFALRAFDSFGNESGAVGDTIDQTTTVNPTGAPGGGAIPVSNGSAGAGGSVLGAKTGAGSETTGGAAKEGEVKGAETSVTPEPSAEEKKEETAGASGIVNAKTAAALVLIVVAAGAIYFIVKRKSA